MVHEKKYHASSLNTPVGEIKVEGPVSSSQLATMEFHPQLQSFRPSNKQFDALLEIADLDEGRIIVSHHLNTIVGYVTFLHPDPLERWSHFQMDDLLELGAIEIAPPYRGLKLGSELIRVAMMDAAMEDYIVISTEYYWHWDLKETKLSVWNYRKIMEKMMSVGGLTPAPTDDPEIISHPANCLMVRIGENVPKTSIDLFDRLRFLDKNKFRPNKF